MVAALARIASYGACDAPADGSLGAVLAYAGMPATALAPLLALGSSLNVGDAPYVLAATPVKLAITGDDVRVMRLSEIPPNDYVSSTINGLNRHFVDDGLVFHAKRANRWLVTSKRVPDMATTPLSAVSGGSLYTHRPTGLDARRWEGHGNEIQMMLFARHGGGFTGTSDGNPESLPDGVWFWGGGAWPVPLLAGVPQVHVTHDDEREEADLARGLAVAAGMPVHRLTHTGDAMASLIASCAGSNDDVLVVAPTMDSRTSAACWLQPALRALENHALQRLTVITGSDHARRCTALAPSRWQRLRARWARSPGAASAEAPR